jgi:putative ABC transport system permease protein
LGAGTKKATMRKVLVVLQFSVSIFMIVGIIVILKQLEYVKNKDLGFDREHILILRGGGSQNEALKDRLLQNASVTSVSFSRNIPGRYSGDDTFLPQGKSREETFRASAYWVGYDFLETYGVEIVWGRGFSREFPSDAEQAVLLNETAAREIGWGEEAVGKTMVNVSRENAQVKVVGVVSDFHHRSLKLAINPMVIALDARSHRYVSVKIAPQNVAGTLSYMEGVWQDIYPRQNFTYYFMDDDFRGKYQSEDRVQEVYVYFGILAIFVACLGLYGLASFTAEQRTKEIGIRKVMGASLGSIVMTLSKEFMKWVLVANLIAWPVSYYIMNNWLNEFAYRISIGWWIFGVSALIALTIALFTVGHQAFRSAIANPSDSLRYE